MLKRLNSDDVIPIGNGKQGNEVKYTYTIILEHTVLLVLDYSVPPSRQADL